MPNPSPTQTKQFKTHAFKPVSDLPDEPLGASPLAVRVGQSVHDAVMALDRRDRINWLRRVITEAANKELT